MVSCSDDVHHTTDESSARIHRERMAVRRGPILTNLQPLLQGHSPRPPVEPIHESLPFASSNKIKCIPTLLLQPQTPAVGQTLASTASAASVEGVYLWTKDAEADETWHRRTSACESHGSGMSDEGRFEASLHAGSMSLVPTESVRLGDGIADLRDSTHLFFPNMSARPRLVHEDAFESSAETGSVFSSSGGNSGSEIPVELASSSSLDEEYEDEDYDEDEEDDDDDEEEEEVEVEDNLLRANPGADQELGVDCALDPEPEFKKSEMKTGMVEDFGFKFSGRFVDESTDSTMTEPEDETKMCLSKEEVVPEQPPEDRREPSAYGLYEPTSRRESVPVAGREIEAREKKDAIPTRKLSRIPSLERQVGHTYCGCWFFSVFIGCE
ncbi:unnamed protein product [Protopolystoma xenopodis]|uniref:Uncharacterized protein n=1 Tax=Protopolystoma xenopodis TaxID=117903 RepID=A0A448XLA6_9PLAT|nr:unnamed protein product [Protopolystoma xenopodis]